MKHAIFVLLIFCFFIGNYASADSVCNKATFQCIDLATKTPMFESKQAVRFCTINDHLTRKELLAKFSYYEMCTSYAGIVNVTWR